MDERELLRSVPLFSELSEADLTSLSRLTSRRRYPKDTVVFFENEEGDFFFTIVEGRNKVTILGDDGREIILSMLGPGDFFGEMALLDNEPRSATAIAVEESELLSLHRTDFQGVIGVFDPTGQPTELHHAAAGRIIRLRQRKGGFAALRVTETRFGGDGTGHRLPVEAAQGQGVDLLQVSGQRQVAIGVEPAVTRME